MMPGEIAAIGGPDYWLLWPANPPDVRFVVNQALPATGLFFYYSRITLHCSETVSKYGGVS